MLLLEAPSIVINKHILLVSISLPPELGIVVLLGELLHGINKACEGRVGRHGQGARCLCLRNSGQVLAECWGGGCEQPSLHSPSRTSPPTLPRSFGCGRLDRCTCQQPAGTPVWSVPELHRNTCPGRQGADQKISKKTSTAGGWCSAATSHLHVCWRSEVDVLIL